ncbi:MAG: hypothetical protein KKG97_03045, partial [Proteobacteria bacterium]|nr:hypothetical protein [Pseudomonadota bacterium]
IPTIAIIKKYLLLINFFNLLPFFRIYQSIAFLIIFHMKNSLSSKNCSVNDSNSRQSPRLVTNIIKNTKYRPEVDRKQLSLKN